MRFFPRAVKSIQTGTIALASVTSNTATITAVDTNYSFVRLMGIQGADGNPVSNLARVRLTSSTQVTAYAQGLTSTLTVGYEVIELYQFFVRQAVQEGFISLAASGSTTGTATIVAALGTGEVCSNGANVVLAIVNANTVSSVMSRVSVSGTTLTATRGDATNAAEVGWTFIDWR